MLLRWMLTAECIGRVGRWENSKIVRHVKSEQGACRMSIMSHAFVRIGEGK